MASSQHHQAADDGSITEKTVYDTENKLMEQRRQRNKIAAKRYRNSQKEKLFRLADRLERQERYAKFLSDRVQKMKKVISMIREALKYDYFQEEKDQLFISSDSEKGFTSEERKMMHSSGESDIETSCGIFGGVNTTVRNRRRKSIKQSKSSTKSVDRKLNLKAMPNKKKSTAKSLLTKS